MTADDSRTSPLIPRCRIDIRLTDDGDAAVLGQTLPESVTEPRSATSGSASGTSDERSPVVFTDLPVNEATNTAPLGSDAVPPPTVFVTRGEPDARQWSEVERLGARWLIASELLDHRRCVSAAIRAATGDPWHFDPASWGAGAMFETTQIGSSGDRDQMIDSLLRELRAHPVWSRSIDHHRLVVEELINNALLHAFESDPDHRYVPGSFERLLDDDRVSLRHRIDDEVFWFSVADNAGSLKTATVSGHIRRHLDAAGLLDGGGRGLFIAFALANVFAVNIDDGHGTEVSVGFLAGRPQSHKLVLINTAPAS